MYGKFVNMTNVSKQTSVTVGLVIIIILGVWSVASAWTKTNIQIELIATEIASLKVEMNEQFSGFQSQLHDAADDRFRRTDMMTWAYEFAEHNRDLYVPDPNTDSRGQISIPPNSN